MASRKYLWKIEPLDPNRHDGAAFFCEQESLTNYLQRYAVQHLKRRIAAVLVLTPDGRTIAGYYTLSRYAIRAGSLPAELIQKLKLPRYEYLPATLLGRLARDPQFRGQAIGELLLMDALRRVSEQSRAIASVALVVDAIEERAKNFYAEYGFTELPEYPIRLLFPMATVAQMFAG